MEEDIKWKAFFAARRIKFNRRGKKKWDVYRIFGFLSDILYDLLFCLIIVHLTKESS